MSVIKKAVFPVAGLGTRFLPATKANPKEMLPIVDKPLIQYAAEEAVAAGITELIFVTNSTKRTIEDHFDTNYILEDKLSKRSQQQRLHLVRHTLPEGVTCAYVRQRDPLGLGHAILCAAPLVGNEPFAVLLADDLIDGGDTPCLKQMVALFAEAEKSIVSVQRIPQQDTRKYGIVATSASSEHYTKIEGIIEKPEPEDAPSNLAAIGRYILTPEIFPLLATTQRGKSNEIQLTDAIASLLKQQDVLAFEFAGKRYDCGSKLGYLQATIEFGLKHPEVGDEFRQWLQKN